MLREEILHKISESREINRVNQQNIDECRNLGLNNFEDGLGCVLGFDDSSYLEGSGGWAWALGEINGAVAYGTYASGGFVLVTGHGVAEFGYWPVCAT